MAITLNGPALYQWDARRTVTVDASIAEVHFAISGDAQALVVVPDNGVADVPNILLQRTRYLDVWTFYDEKTIETVRFTITPRAKPMDYIYEPTHIQTIEELTKEVKAAIEESAKAAKFASDTAEGLLKRASNGDFDGPQGVKGDGYASATATVDASTGTPSVTVTQTGDPKGKTLNFAFTGLKGETGDVANISATPPLTYSGGNLGLNVGPTMSTEGGALEVNLSAAAPLSYADGLLSLGTVPITLGGTGQTSEAAAIAHMSGIAPGADRLITKGLQIEPTDPFSELSLPAVIATEDASTLINCPVKSGPFYAYRTVYPIKSTTDKYSYVVYMHEVAPTAGRVWMSVYDGKNGNWVTTHQQVLPSAGSGTAGGQLRQINLNGEMVSINKFNFTPKQRFSNSSGTGIITMGGVFEVWATFWPNAVQIHSIGDGVTKTPSHNEYVTVQRNDGKTMYPVYQDDPSTLTGYRSTGGFFRTDYKGTVIASYSTTGSNIFDLYPGLYHSAILYVQ